MLDELLNKVRRNVEETGNHWQWECNELGLSLTGLHISQLADDCNHKRLKKFSGRYLEGNHEFAGGTEEEHLKKIRDIARMLLIAEYRKTL